MIIFMAGASHFWAILGCFLAILAEIFVKRYFNSSQHTKYNQFDILWKFEFKQIWNVDFRAEMVLNIWA